MSGDDVSSPKPRGSSGSSSKRRSKTVSSRRRSPPRAFDEDLRRVAEGLAAGPTVPASTVALDAASSVSQTRQRRRSPVPPPHGGLPHGRMETIEEEVSGGGKSSSMFRPKLDWKMVLLIVLVVVFGGAAVALYLENTKSKKSAESAASEVEAARESASRAEAAREQLTIEEQKKREQIEAANADLRAAVEKLTTENEMLREEQSTRRDIDAVGSGSESGADMMDQPHIISPPSSGTPVTPAVTTAAPAPAAATAAPAVDAAAPAAASADVPYDSETEYMDEGEGY